MSPVRLLFFTALLISIGSCTDKAEQIPAYIRIQPFVVNAGGDADWHKITDGWLYVNGEYLGAYTLPATVPVLAEGDAEIQLFPGVKENGITATPNIYPFLTRYVQTLNLVPAETRDFQPSTEYDPNAVFPWSVERGAFDGGSNILLENRDGDPDNTFVLTTDGAFAGKCILMQVDTDHPIMEVVTEPTTLPATYEREVWLELHYRNDVPFFLYLSGKINGVDSNYPVFQFNPSTDGDWNKTYLNLTDALIALTDATEYRLLFRLGLPVDETGKISADQGEIRLDNLRLVHF